MKAEAKAFYGEGLTLDKISKHCIRPCRDIIVIEYEDEEEKTATGRLVIPEKARTKSLFARVLAVGPGKWIEIDRKKFAKARLQDGVGTFGRSGSKAMLMKSGINQICDAYGVIGTWFRVPCVLKPNDRIAVPAFNFPRKCADGVVYLVQEDAILGTLK